MVLLPCLAGSSYAATIWSEDFSSFVDVGISGAGNEGGYPGAATNWSLNVSACTLSDLEDYFMAVDTLGGRMEAVDVDGEAIWTSENIDISGHNTISISVDTSETGSSANTNKYVKLFYCIDGGIEQAFATNPESIGNFGSATASQTGLNGTNLQIVARVNNPNSGDKSIFDNVLIEGVVNPPFDTPPSLVLTPSTTNMTTSVSNELSFLVSAVESDGDTITLNAVDVPSGASFDEVTGLSVLTNTFTWSPEASQTGQVAVTFWATDNDGSNGVTVQIHVDEQIHPVSSNVIMMQSFETTGADTWAFTTNPTSYNVSDDVWDRVGLLGTIPSPTNGSYFWGMRDLNNPNGGGNFYHTLVFEPINISWYTDVTLLFSYFTHHFNTDSDIIRYSVQYNDGTEWTDYVELEKETDAWTPVSISVPSSAQYIRLSLEAKVDGTDDFAGWDYIQLVGDEQGPLIEFSPSETEKYILVSNELSFTVSALANNAGTMDLLATGLPSGAVFTPTSGPSPLVSSFSWTPTATQTGVYTVSFLAGNSISTNTEVVTITVEDKLISFLTTDLTLDEDAGTQQVAVVISRPADTSIDIGCSGTAAYGIDEDYLISPTTVVFSSLGSVTQFIELIIYDDWMMEDDKTAILTLQNPVDGAVNSNNQMEIVIQDNDHLFSENFDTDPGWITEDQWAFGPPVGDGAAGNQPTNAYSGTNVYGFNLAGDYPNNMTGVVYLTTPAIDCSAYMDIQLTFYRWLGVESASYDHAGVQVSRDGITWTSVWQNTSTTIRDEAWQEMTLDISDLADYQSEVYIRWSMGTTDYSVYYCGWNIDDVELIGTPIDRPIVQFSQDSYGVLEPSMLTTVVVERVGITTGVVQVEFTTLDDTAIAGDDYNASNGVLTFLDGEIRKDILVTITNDSIDEDTESFLLALTNIIGGALGTPSEIAIGIIDDDQPRASFPFFEGFESGVLSNYWASQSTSPGRIRIGSDDTLILPTWLEEFDAPYDGTNQLCMDSATNGFYALNELTLSIDLSGQTNVILSCMVKDLYDYSHGMSEQFTDSDNSDGIAISEDGYHWHRITALPRTYPPTYENILVDLNAFAASNSLSLDGLVLIKFQQYDYAPFENMRGRLFDNIAVFDGSTMADIALKVTSQNPVALSEFFGYTLIVSNRGPGNATSVVLSNVLPDEVEYFSTTMTQGTYSVTGRVVVCNLGDMEAGAAVPVIITCRAIVEGFSTNYTIASSSTSDLLPANNEQRTVTQISPVGGDIYVSAVSQQLREGQSNYYVYVWRTNSLAGEISVDLRAIDQSASNTVDYVFPTQTLTFANGVSVKVAALPILDDDTIENQESFEVILENPTGGAQLMAPSNLVFEIADNDGVASYPFFDGFEASTLSNCWSLYGGAYRRIQTTADYIPYAGYRHVTLDAQYSTYNLNELILTVDLENETGVYLQFYQKEFNDEDHLMNTTFSGHENSDGVALSVDGTNWFKVQGLTAAEGSGNTYNEFEVALDSVMTNYGLAYSNPLYIKFQQYGYSALEYDGFAFDNIRLYGKHGQIQFSAPAYGVDEELSSVTVQVQRVSGTSGEVSIDYATADGTALAGTDYQMTTGTLIFAESEDLKELVIPIIADSLTEGDETFFIGLTNAAGGAELITPSTSVITILDDDGPGKLSFSSFEYSAPETTSSTATITVIRSEGKTGEVTIEYYVEANTASAGIDFVSETGTLVFASGEISKPFSVHILEDEDAEPNETIQLTLQHPTGGCLLGTIVQSTLNIIDDDDPYYDYYANAYGKENAELKQALHEIIKDHTLIRYDWAPSQELDENPDDPNQVMVIYRQIGIDKNAHGTSSGLWNREHVWAKSHGFAGEPDISKPPSVDLHNLRAVEHTMNSTRNDRDFDEGGERILDTPETCSKDNDNWTFEPPNTAKGDVARTFFYMAVRYEGDSAKNEPDLEILDESTSVDEPRMGVLSTLIRWHNEDPPDTFEMRRNNLIYSNYQSNRNPFIDHPEWVADVWGNRITTYLSEHGTATPMNPMVDYGYDQVFSITPDPYYHIEQIQTNQTTVSDVDPEGYILTWSNIKTTGLLEVTFAANMASNTVPEWWLAEYGLTNDFTTASTTEDYDQDGMLNWHEWIAGTDPTNQLSLLELNIAENVTDRSKLQFQWQGVSDRSYTLYKCTNLISDLFQPMTTRQAEITGLITITNSVIVDEKTSFYHLNVEYTP